MASIQSYTPFTERELRNASADIQGIWSQWGREWHIWTNELHRRWPQAFDVPESVWFNVFGNGVPRPDVDPARKERERLARIREHSKGAPTDPSTLAFWMHAIEGRRLIAGVQQRFSTAEEAIAAAHQDQLEALEQRDAWRVSQEMAKAHGIDDRTMQGREAQREAIEAVQELEARLRVQREADMAALRNPSPAVAEEAGEVGQ